MRTSNSQVPRQLHTVAVRYRHDLADEPFQRHMSFWDGEPERPSPAPTSSSHRDERLQRLEAILLLSREPLSSRRLSQYANLADATEARTLVRHLNDKMDASGRAFRVEEVAGGFQLLTRPKFARWLRRLANIPKELRLSAPALETLSVIAYRQPAGRAEIEAVRGVNCGEIVRQLLERDLVRVAGRSDDLGRPYLYATTRRFLQLFGLRNLDDLPRAEQLRKQNSTQNSNRQSTDTTEIRKTDSPDRNEEEFDVTATISAELSPEELRKTRRGGVPSVLPRASDNEEYAEEDTDDKKEDEELDDLDDEDEDDDDEFDDDEDDDEEFDDVDDEEGFEEEEWEEVDDEDDDLDEEDDDDDWDDDEDEEDEEEDDGASWE